jgi:glutamate synthase domain-containing protein 2/glutamate synthase domain-containing protein 1/glutamate synthase domain-containing protein 3
MGRARARTGGLYEPAFEHDACGVGFLADLSGRPNPLLLPLALTALGRMAHRGAVDADGVTGDGAGVTTQIPFAVLRGDLEAMGLSDLNPGRLAVGLVFLPQDPASEGRARELLLSVLDEHGLPFLGFRRVPVRDQVLGEKARRSRPGITHLVVGRPPLASDAEFERRLYRARRELEARARGARLDDLYVASLSHRTLVYKALLKATDLADFYPDLRHPAYATAFALFHQRFSTNTFPSWAMTQPFRLLAHNGEINTIEGNRSWMRAREAGLCSGLLGLEAGGLRPALPEGTSDSASLDEALALLTLGGRDVTQGVSLLIPPAWEGDSEMPPEVRAFFEYQSCLLEPWDGPALVVFTDGKMVGAALDRNGLRPARYAVTLDGLVMVASEAGVLDCAPDRILHRGRLGPGDMVAVDLSAGRFLDREAIHGSLAARRPYAAWLESHRVPFARIATAPAEGGTAGLGPLRAFGYTREEMQLVLGPMFKDGLEPLGSMGDDTPLAVLSRRPRLLYSYFKQRFAQVTNPPIDPLRESLVMSLATHLGPQGNLLAEAPEHAAQVHLEGPLLREEELKGLETWPGPGWASRRLSLLFPAQGGVPAFRRALARLCRQAAAAVEEEGATLLVLSDRGVDERRAALPALLAVSAVHQHLIRRGSRPRTSLLAETGEARDDHQVATLLAFGASAVIPYLALAAIAGAVDRAGGGEKERAEAQERYLKTLAKGVLKILSKMGISTLRSYHGAQLFEAVGVSSRLIRRHFTGTPSLLGGVGLPEIAGEVLARHAGAFGATASDLEEGGFHRYRQTGETHAFAPKVVRALHAAISSAEPIHYRAYASLVHSRDPLVVRDLLEFSGGDPVPLEEVEAVEAILPRFMTAAMSLGALSPEAHEVLAIGMNRMGARSNSGEGGEPPEVYWKALPGADRAHNRIKQVASARFGVTAHYLVTADELQIKMAQGSKPGEGGQLPGHKVAPHIARVRHASPGITLISPPPHHDIYSIEDLAQLIYDLKRVNPAASVAVKLVTEVGVGTVAAGVAKAHADAILIGGYDGGTGASPLGSIKNAGTPWELGLAEAQQVLTRGGLRGRVRLQVEGGLKTGRDVVMAALLGAEEFGFGTTALLALGCVMARQCHLNTCPAGIATQRRDLRQRFSGTPEDVVRFFTAVAGEVREILALLGYRRLGEVIGLTERLEARLPREGKASRVGLERMLLPAPPPDLPRRSRDPRNDPPETGGRLDESVLARVRFRGTTVAPLQMELPITNADRAVGALIAGELARRLPGHPLPPETLRLRFRGSAGQSFGAFCVEGMQLVLEGEANDYVGKGMSGGEIVVRPGSSALPASRPVLAGNTLLYGATGGRLFLAGRSGERFAVRNSGAQAVVEGVGDHACEYMTAGVVIILGETGRNLGAGMSGGSVYALDPEDRLPRRCNLELVAVGPLPVEDEEWLQEGIKLHLEATGSDCARKILDDWAEMRPFFRKVSPRAGAELPRPLPWRAAPRRETLAFPKPAERRLPPPLAWIAPNPQA